MKRIWAVVLRQLYLFPKSLWRMADIFYWPVLDLLLWGFLTLYLQQNPNALSHVGAFLLGALILWDIMSRSQQAVSVSFLEEIWSRNLLNLFARPLGPGEFLAATMVLSFFKLLTAGVLTMALAWVFYSFNILSLGLYLFSFVLALVAMGWSVGIVTTGLVLRFGQKAEITAWGLMFLFQPFSAVFYPVSVLPPFLRPVSYAIPATHVFEGMREVLLTGRTSLPTLLLPWALNAVYLSVALAFFYSMYNAARLTGRLAKLGE